MTQISSALAIAAAGMRAQSSRMRIISENVANASSTAQQADGDPYRRKIPIFQSELDKATGAQLVRMNKVSESQAEFRTVYDPGHPAANEQGYVKYPNVNTLIELMDMREASRSFEANLSVIENTRAMMQRTVELLNR
ncbi:MAG: flagellar basal body rod protein FlgC [Robiginitomaculum sp.]|nr:MAG: flagellar basal body rod protein FlgC [Robiginitomaculum sp.]